MLNKNYFLSSSTKKSTQKHSEAKTKTLLSSEAYKEHNTNFCGFLIPPNITYLYT